MTGIEKTDMLLWMDVETTGLDPDHDRILEVEMRCTDMKGELDVGGFHRVVGLAGRNVSITDENFKAWRMHCANGLLEDAFDAGYTEEATANALEEYVDSLAQSFTLHPAGSNPQFDLDFIEGMACEGGCMYGPANMLSERLYTQARKKLLSQADDRGVVQNARDQGFDKIHMHR